MAIANACRDHERLRFDYASHGGTESRRVVEPHRIVSSGRRWYLLAHDVDRGDWRTFRVDRMRLRLPAGPRFVPRDLSDAEVRERVSGALATAAWAYRARVTVSASAEAVAARLPWPATIEPLDASTCRLDVGSDSPELLAVHLGMLGADFTIDPAESPELTEWLHVLAGRYARAGRSRRRAVNCWHNRHRSDQPSSPVEPSVSSRTMSRCPACRAYSCSTCSRIQWSWGASAGVANRPPREARSSS